MLAWPATWWWKGSSGGNTVFSAECSMSSFKTSQKRNNFNVNFTNNWTNCICWWKSYIPSSSPIVFLLLWITHLLCSNCPDLFHVSGQWHPVVSIQLNGPVQILNFHQRVCLPTVQNQCGWHHERISNPLLLIMLPPAVDQGKSVKPLELCITSRHCVKFWKLGFKQACCNQSFLWNSKASLKNLTQKARCHYHTLVASEHHCLHHLQELGATHDLECSVQVILLANDSTLHSPYCYL